jgi:predicted phosphodiesterase
MRLLAISDLHLANSANRAALAGMGHYGDDWLIVAGDVAERIDQIRDAFALLTQRFARVIWVPGNHDLWTVREEIAVDGVASGQAVLAGEAKYRTLVRLAREFGVVTPEDPYPIWTGPGGPCIIAPLFLLYDYSFRPPEIAREDLIAWSREGSAVCSDEVLLDPDPHLSREAWCGMRCDETEGRLAALDSSLQTILVNHYPLRHELVRIPRIPRFSPWCGTTRTEDWHQRFNAKVVIYGHLHVRRTDIRDGTRFEEVSLGYPRQWDQNRGIERYLREILPGPGLG